MDTQPYRPGDVSTVRHAHGRLSCGRCDKYHHATDACAVKAEPADDHVMPGDAKPANGYPDNNPKSIIGVTKVPLHLVPPSAKHFLALGFKDGAAKYGPYNWRDNAVAASVYIAAAQRHIDAFWDGENEAADSGVSHLAHAMSCMAIVLDAMTLGKLVDDRPPHGAAGVLQSDFQLQNA